LNALDATGGRVSAAAGMLGISRMTLYRLMRKHEIATVLENLAMDSGR
jgi:transcriptional regulator of acetoin/glycerol metabolism